MTFAVILLPVLVVAFIAVLRNRRDAAHLPRVSSGDVDFGPDTDRIRAELTILSRWIK